MLGCDACHALGKPRQKPFNVRGLQDFPMHIVSLLSYLARWRLFENFIPLAARPPYHNPEVPYSLLYVDESRSSVMTAPQVLWGAWPQRTQTPSVSLPCSSHQAAVLST